MPKIRWSVENLILHRKGCGSANTVKSAVRDAKKCFEDELSNGDELMMGEIIIYEDGYPVRVEMKTAFTGLRWKNMDMKDVCPCSRERIDDNVSNAC